MNDSLGKAHASLELLAQREVSSVGESPPVKCLPILQSKEGLVGLVNFLVFWTLSLAFMSFPPSSKRGCFSSEEMAAEWCQIARCMSRFFTYSFIYVFWLPQHYKPVIKDYGGRHRETCQSLMIRGHDWEAALLEKRNPFLLYPCCFLQLACVAMITYLWWNLSVAMHLILSPLPQFLSITGPFTGQLRMTCCAGYVRSPKINLG